MNIAFSHVLYALNMHNRVRLQYHLCVDAPGDEPAGADGRAERPERRLRQRQR